MWVIRPSTLFAHHACWIRSWWCSDSFDNRPSSLHVDWCCINCHINSLCRVMMWCWYCCCCWWWCWFCTERMTHHRALYSQCGWLAGLITTLPSGRFVSAWYDDGDDDDDDVWGLTVFLHTTFYNTTSLEMSQRDAAWWWCEDDSCIEFKCLWSHCHCCRTCLKTIYDRLYARESADGSEGDTASLSIKSIFNMWVIRPSTLFAHHACWIRSWWCFDSFDNRPSSLLTDAELSHLLCRVMMWCWW